MTTETKLVLGELLESTITLSVAGVPTDPGSLQLKYRRFGDAATEVVIAVPNPLSPPAGITRVSAGVFRAVIDLVSAGDWRIRWTSTAPAKSALERRVIVGTIYP